MITRFGDDLSPEGRSRWRVSRSRPRTKPFALVVLCALTWAVPSTSQSIRVNVTVVEDGQSLPSIAGVNVRLAEAGPFGEGDFLIDSGQTGPDGRVTFTLPLTPGNILPVVLDVARDDYSPKTIRIVVGFEDVTGDVDVLIKLERKPPNGDTAGELWDRSSDSEVDLASTVFGIRDPGFEELGPLGLEHVARVPSYHVERFSRDPFDPRPRETFTKSFSEGSEDPLTELDVLGYFDGTFARFAGVQGGRGVVEDLIPRGGDGMQMGILVEAGRSVTGASASAGEPAFSVRTAGTLGGQGPAFLKSVFDQTGELLEVVVEQLNADCRLSSPPVTTDRGDRPGAFAYCPDRDLFVDLDPEGRRNVPDFRPGGAGKVFDIPFGGWQTQAAALPDSGTLVLSSRSPTPFQEGDFTCRSGSSLLYMTQYSATGERVIEHQLGDPVATRVGQGCFPNHTQQTAAVRYGESWGVAYQVGDDLRLSTRELASGAEPRTYSLGPLPTALEGVFFWQPATLGDRDSGSFLIDLPNGPTFEGSEDGERLGLPPWQVVNRVLDLPLEATGELLPHALASDLSGRGWLIGTFARDALGPNAPPGITDQAVAEVSVPGCLDTDTRFCASHNRFAVSARFTTPDGTSQDAHARSLTNDSGTFWFFDPGNRELIAKVLPACGINGHHWFFVAGLTDVGIQLELWDLLTGEAKLYFNPQGQPFQPILDTTAMPCDANEAASELEAAIVELAGAEPMVELLEGPSSGKDGTACGGDPENLCLRDGRFRVDVLFVDPVDGPTLAFGGNLTDDTGALFFFDEANVELLVKVLDACDFNDRFWVFAGGLTNVEVGVRVIDTETGEIAEYNNPSGQPFEPITDTSAFVCDAR